MHPCICQSLATFQGWEWQGRAASLASRLCLTKGSSPEKVAAVSGFRPIHRTAGRQATMSGKT